MCRIWEPNQFLLMALIVVALTSAYHMLCIFIITRMNTQYKMASPPCTLNIIVAIVLLGIRQNFFEAKLVTPIPIYEKTLKIPFKVCNKSTLCKIVFLSHICMRVYCFCYTIRRII